MALVFTDKKGREFEPPVPLAPLADSHGHLTHFRRHGAAEAIVRAALAGVRMMVVPVDPVDEVGPGLRFETPAAFLSWLDEQVERARGDLGELASRGISAPEFPDWPDVPDLLDNVRIVAGVHPYGALQLDAAAMARMDELLDSPRCVGVGEFGIDVGPWSELPAEAQEPAFRAQLRVAHERNLPVELHLRDEEDGVHATGHDVALRVLREEGVPAAGCDLHCFTSDAEVMAPFVELGCHIAFGGAATFASNQAIREAVAACPEHLLLSETDSPYMAPVPLRGTECEPAMVAFSAACVADVREQVGVASREQTYAALWRNACALLGR